MKVKWTTGAIKQLDGVHEYYAQFNLVVAAHLYQQIEKSVQRLEKFPESGRPGRRLDTRELVVSNAPFVIIYRIGDREVQIIRVMHNAQNHADKW